MVSQERLHQLEQHEKDMEDGITASDEESSSEEGTPEEENQQTEDEKEEVIQGAHVEDNTEASSAGEESSTAAPKKRRRKKVFQPAELEAMSPKPSLWPLILAFSVAVLLAGAVSSRIILGIGFVLILGSIIGWLRERR